MAQKTEKEETEFKVHETLTLCVNNCGVTGNPATNNMCQNCFTATTASSCDGGGGGASKVLKVSKDRSPRSSIDRLDSQATTSSRSDRSSNKADPPPPPPSTPVFAKRVVNRCSGCKRKVGLTGFRCRCGELFCSEHRYSDRHVCSYDYKAAAREAIARENPVVKAAKIVRV